jgi:hypothetical protein
VELALERAVQVSSKLVDGLALADEPAKCEGCHTDKQTVIQRTHTHKFTLTQAHARTHSTLAHLGHVELVQCPTAVLSLFAEEPQALTHDLVSLGRCPQSLLLAMQFVSTGLALELAACV